MLHILSGCGCRASSRSVSVDNVEVVKGSVKGFDTGDGDLDLESKFERRSEVCLDLHRTLSLEVHPHCAVGFLWLCHLANRGLLEIGGECAALGIGKCQ